VNERVSPAMLAELQFLQWLKQECGYRDPRPLPGGRWAAIFPLMYTHAIIVGTVGSYLGYDDRWCYDSYERAKTALDAWDGQSEPEGWHRHPMSGRRRVESDPSSEYVAL
jgi:hypothetical protein